MFLKSISRLFAMPLLQVVDGAGGGAAGAGGGGAAGAGGGQMAGGGAAGAGGGQAAAGVGGGSGFSLTDDAVVTINGKTAPWKDHRSTLYVDKTTHDGYAKQLNDGVRTRLTDFLSKLQGRLPNGQQGGQPGQGGGGQPNAFAELLKNVSQQPVLDGKTATELIQAGYGPLVATIQKQQAVLDQLQKRLGSTETGLNREHGRRLSGEIDGLYSSAISAIGEGYDPKNPILRELAADVFNSHDWAKGKAREEFPAKLKERIDGMVKLVREMDRARVDQRKKEPLKFLRPGGDGTPSGAAGKHKLESNREIASRAFAQRRGELAS